MTIGELVTVIVLSLLFLWTCRYILRYRIYFSRVAGTFSAIVVGMDVGFLTGMGSFLFFGQTYVMSTLIGICVGLGAGWFVGIPISNRTIVDGSLAGIAGGTLGSLIIHLMPYTYSKQTWMASSIVSLLLFGMVLYRLLKEIPPYEQVGAKKMLQSPFIVGPILIIVFYIYQLIEPYAPQSEDPTVSPPKKKS